MKARDDDYLTIAYPCLRKSKLSSLVVLFSGEGQGMVVFADSIYDIGHYDADNWDDDTFEDFKGTVELSN